MKGSDFLFLGIPVAKLIHIVKYIAASLAMYFGISVALFVAIDLCEFPHIASYLIVYFFSYVVDYIVNLRFIFVGSHCRGMVYRYTTHVCFFYLLNVSLFKLLTGAGIDYLLATWSIVVLLFPVRYLSYRFFVYRK